VSDDRANFGCRHSDISWSVVCRDRKWIGAHRNCTSGINGGSGSARRHATRNGGLCKFKCSLCARAHAGNSNSQEYNEIIVQNNVTVIYH
jgi:hypothetical protein